MQRHPHRQYNGNAQQQPNPPYLIRTSLTRYIREQWFTNLIGIIGFIAGLVVIVGNEARAVHISKSLEESVKLITTLSPDSDLDPSNIGKLVYITGVMTIHEPLTEPDYGISVLAVKLFKNVQMYQWQETDNDVYDGEGNIITTDYYYHKDWFGHLIDSSRFYNSLTHRNPKEFPIKKQTQINENVKIGKYNLGLELKKKFNNFETITSDERPERSDIKLHAGMYYHSSDLWDPEIGDVRIQFSYAGHNREVLTIVAQLDNKFTLVPYTSKVGLDVLLFRQGQYSLEDMFTLEQSQNKFQTWVYRGLGWLLLYISCICLTTILQIIVSHSNFLQEIFPVSHSSLKMSVSITMSLIATALAWVWYRPLIGIGMIITTVFMLFFIRWYSARPVQYNRL